MDLSTIRSGPDGQPVRRNAGTKNGANWARALAFECPCSSRDLARRSDLLFFSIFCARLIFHGSIARGHEAALEGAYYAF
jgi:hypothetical protein